MTEDDEAFQVGCLDQIKDPEEQSMTIRLSLTLET